ncbi:MAG: gluconate permease, partial [Planctomycetota bacterium]
MNTWLIVGLAVAVILGGILVLRLHAFLSLLFAAFLVACLSTGSTVQEYVESEVAAERMQPAVGLQLQQQTPTTRLTEAFAKTVGGVGILIALASVIGSMLSHSGAAHR